MTIDKLKSILNRIIDCVLPKDPETLEIEKMSETYLIENIPQANDMKNESHKSVFQYKNKITRKAVWEIKYNKNELIINKFSNILYGYIIDNISDEMIFGSFSNPILMPIPMHKNNIKTRGFNQSELIAKELYKIDNAKNFSISFDALIKKIETKHQSTIKNKTKRLNNLRNCFYANTEKIKGRNIILIDDVITTGATINEASFTLKRAGAKKILAFSIAH